MHINKLPGSKVSGVLMPGQCPLWVKSRHSINSGRCPLYPQKRTSDLCTRPCGADVCRSWPGPPLATARRRANAHKRSTFLTHANVRLIRESGHTAQMFLMPEADIWASSSDVRYTSQNDTVNAVANRLYITSIFSGRLLTLNIFWKNKLLGIWSTLPLSSLSVVNIRFRSTTRPFRFSGKISTVCPT